MKCLLQDEEDDATMRMDDLVAKLLDEDNHNGCNK